MKKLAMLVAVVVVAIGASCSPRVESKRGGLQPGELVGPFTVEKVAGNPNDSVEVGEHLCYFCKLGSRPVVMVFARKPDSAVTELVKQIDAKLPEHADQKLASFVSIIGSKDASALKATAKNFGDEANLENVAIVVPEDSENGPPEFTLDPQAETIVVLYRGGKVAANHAFGPGKLDQHGIEVALADLPKILD